MALNLPTPAPEKPAKTPDKKPALLTGVSLKDVIAAIQKQKGDRTIMAANSIPPVERLPTGIFEFDYYTGGGFPKGRYTILYGPESSGKTNLSLLAAAQAQKGALECNKVVWFDIEQTFDPIWAAKLGVDTEKLTVVNPAYGEEAVDLFDAVVRAEDVALVVVDSMAALIANKEVKQSTETYDIGTSALLIKRMVNKLMIAFGEAKKHDRKPCVILINQTRFKPGVMFGDPETMPGGEAQKFLASLRIRLYATNEVDKATNMIAFKKTKAVVKKSKVQVRAASFEFDLCVYAHDELSVGDTDSFTMVKGHLQALGLMGKTSKGYEIPELTITSPTLGQMQSKYYTDAAFRLKLQTLVIQNSQDQMMLVEEEDGKGPADVPPGIPQPTGE